MKSLLSERNRLPGYRVSAKREVEGELDVPVLMVLLFTLYSITSCPTVYPGDSGELSAAAFSLGIPHNSGYPLYSILGKAFSLIPLGSLGFRLNLLSVLFAVLTVGLLVSVLRTWTSSRWISLSVGLFLAFSSKVWTQANSAEVYALHLFFVICLVWILAKWDREQRWFWLAVLAFASGLSFGNHLQTLMLGPGVLWILAAGDRSILLRPRNLGLIAALFLVPLLIYVYLPARTLAGATVTWGDPDSLARFLAHVSATSHREGYVLNQSFPEYAQRTVRALSEIWMAFGPMLLLAFWGWWRVLGRHWKTAMVLFVGMDLAYTVFLNTVSLEITPFSLTSFAMVSLMMGLGIADAWSSTLQATRRGVVLDRAFLAGLCVLPVVPLASNLDRCDQSRNYTAYEHAVNMFRTVGFGDTLLVNGDNHVFPAAYGRIVERMRKDVRLYDRHNIIFKLPGAENTEVQDEGEWAERRREAEREILASTGAGRYAYYAVFSTHGLGLPAGYKLVPQGVLHSAVAQERPRIESPSGSPWSRYTWESLQEDYYRDYMTREICSFYYFSRGKHLFRTGHPSRGLSLFELASRIGYNDQLIHSEMGVFLTDRGYFEAARKELSIATTHHESLHIVHNNWGYYYQKLGEYEKAAEAFRRALRLEPESVADLNNLGFALYELGKREESRRVLRRSLSIDPEQPAIRQFVRGPLVTAPEEASVATPQEGISPPGN